MATTNKRRLAEIYNKSKKREPDVHDINKRTDEEKKSQDEGGVHFKPGQHAPGEFLKGQKPEKTGED